MKKCLSEMYQFELVPLTLHKYSLCNEFLRSNMTYILLLAFLYALDFEFISFFFSGDMATGKKLLTILKPKLPNKLSKNI